MFWDTPWHQKTISQENWSHERLRSSCKSRRLNNSTVAKAINGLAPADRAEASRAHACMPDWLCNNIVLCVTDVSVLQVIEAQEAMADLLIKEDADLKKKSQLIKDKYSNMLNNGNRLGSKVVTQTYDYYLAKRAKLAK